MHVLAGNAHEHVPIPANGLSGQDRGRAYVFLNTDLPRRFPDMFRCSLTCAHESSRCKICHLVLCIWMSAFIYSMPISFFAWLFMCAHVYQHMLPATKPHKTYTGLSKHFLSVLEVRMPILEPLCVCRSAVLPPPSATRTTVRRRWQRSTARYSDLLYSSRDM